MALSVGAGGGHRRSRRRGRPRQTLSEINVTPLVDVMLVLLIIFMISAPLLTSGVEVNLPKTEAGAVKDQDEPIILTVRSDGAIFLQDDQIPFEALAPRLQALGGGASERVIFVRGDGGATWESIAKVMGRLQASGFSKVSLITDTAASSAAPVAKPAAAKPGEAN